MAGSRGGVGRGGGCWLVAMLGVGGDVGAAGLGGVRVDVNKDL